MTDKTDLPTWSEDEADMPACPQAWPGRGCAPDWSGECQNCCRVVCQPRELDRSFNPVETTPVPLGKVIKRRVRKKS